MQSGTSQQQFLLLFKHCAVGGQDHPESGFMCQFQKLTQLRVAQWFTHEMKVEKIRIWAQFRKQTGEFFLRHGSFFPLGAGTKSAG